MKGVREGSIETVNAKLMHRLSADPPPRPLVERYECEMQSTTYDIVHAIHLRSYESAENVHVLSYLQNKLARPRLHVGTVLIV